jgi:hypothetical protein
VRAPIDEARFVFAGRQSAKVAAVAIDDGKAVGISGLEAEHDLFAIR